MIRSFLILYGGAALAQIRIPKATFFGVRGTQTWEKDSTLMMMQTSAHISRKSLLKGARERSNKYSSLLHWTRLYSAWQGVGWAQHWWSLLVICYWRWDKAEAGHVLMVDFMFPFRSVINRFWFLTCCNSASNNNKKKIWMVLTKTSLYRETKNHPITN